LLIIEIDWADLSDDEDEKNVEEEKPEDFRSKPAYPRKESDHYASNQSQSHRKKHDIDRKFKKIHRFFH